jgi:hypothetical protein
VRDYNADQSGELPQVRCADIFARGMAWRHAAARFLFLRVCPRTDRDNQRQDKRVMIGVQTAETA